MKYFGLPYKGSKSQIGSRLIETLPSARHFYDLFGGGGAVSHLAVLSGKYDYVHYNEINPLVYDGFCRFCRGDFVSDRRWVSREEFHRLKDTDPYVAIVFSFGTNMRSYLYCKELEPWKQALHMARVLGEPDILEEIGFEVRNPLCYSRRWINERSAECKFAYLSWLQRKYKTVSWDEDKIWDCADFGCLETERRIRRINHGDNLSQIICTNVDYREVFIEPDSVIYCDPPYIETEQYPA